MAPRQDTHDIDFTIITPFLEHEEQTAVHWLDPRVGKLVMVERYSDSDEPRDMTDMLPILSVLSFILTYWAGSLW